jgi:NADH:ubiquinone oxidoreductase subunit F (NADH-binding)/NADH:ubiquinone oxidoreductase subunit E
MTRGASIVQALRAIQTRFGYIPKAEAEKAAASLGVPQHRVWEVATTFPLFRTTQTPPPRMQVHVCRDLACCNAGAAEMRKALEDCKRKRSLPDDELTIDGVSCLGRCDRAVAVRVTCAVESGGEVVELNYLNRSPKEVCDLVDGAFAGRPLPAPDLDANHDMDPPCSSWKIDPYQRSAMRYSGVRKLGQDIVSGRQRWEQEGKPKDRLYKRVRFLRELLRAGLLGMGGAGGRVYKKWQEVLSETKDEKYIVCNGDESEPSTFKDRELLLRMPHLVLEGMVLAGFVTGAKRGIVYIRHEYPEQIAAVEAAIADARAKGVCGIDACGTGQTFELEVFVSPGGYICGEQSALLEALEDRRAEPRNRPPELQVSGLYGKPTVVNNVESFAWVPTIAAAGMGAAYRETGHGSQRGRRLFSLCGDVVRPGVHEFNIGHTLRDLVEKCGGLTGGRKLLAAALSGPSGGFTPARLPIVTGSGDRQRDFRADVAKNLQRAKDTFKKNRARLVELAAGAKPEKNESVEELEFATLGALADVRMWDRFLRRALPEGRTEWKLLEMPLDLAFSRATKMMLGAGIMVVAEGSDLFALAKSGTEFYAAESCGKCVPCRLGTQQLVRIAGEVERGEGSFADHQSQVYMLDEAMESASICGLGQIAANPLETFLRSFPHLVPASKSIGR